MRIVVSSESLLFSDQGVLYSRELHVGNKIGGVDSAGKMKFSTITNISLFKDMRQISEISTDLGVMYVGIHQGVWTNEGVRVPSELTEALTDDYSGSKMEGSINASYFDIQGKHNQDINQSFAYALGLATRQVYSPRSELIIKLPLEISERKIKDMIAVLNKCMLLKSNNIEVYNGSFWKWIKFDAKESTSDILGKWIFEKDVPHEIRTAGMNPSRRFIEGCLDVRLVEDSMIFGFEEKRIMRYLCLMLPLCIQNEFLLTPKPLYSPVEYEITLSTNGNGRVRSVIPISVDSVMLEFQDDLWDPFVDRFLVHPS